MPKLDEDDTARQRVSGGATTSSSLDRESQSAGSHDLSGASGPARPRRDRQEPSKDVPDWAAALEAVSPLN
jgi:hypothetical protein